MRITKSSFPPGERMRIIKPHHSLQDNECIQKATPTGSTRKTIYATHPHPCKKRWNGYISKSSEHSD